MKILSWLTICAMEVGTDQWAIALVALLLLAMCLPAGLPVGNGSTDHGRPMRISTS